MNIYKQKISLVIILTILFSGLIACNKTSNKPVKNEFLNNSYSIKTPKSWSHMTDLNEEADLQMGNLRDEAYVVILSEHKADFNDVTLQGHSDLTRSLIKEALTNYQESEAQHSTTIGKYPVIRYQIEGNIEKINVVYWHATVETEEHFHQMLLWSLKSKFNDNKADFASVIRSFDKVKVKSPGKT